MIYLYRISLLKKYIFGFVVAAYLLSVAGIPIYLHYCGGELEKINYVLKSDGCCGDDEGHDAPSDDSCCKDEHVFLKHAIDFTFKPAPHGDFVKTFTQLFYLSLFNSPGPEPDMDGVTLLLREVPPPGRQQSLLISTSVLRI